MAEPKRPKYTPRVLRALRRRFPGPWGQFAPAQDPGQADKLQIRAPIATSGALRDGRNGDEAQPEKGRRKTRPRPGRQHLRHRGSPPTRTPLLILQKMQFVPRRKGVRRSTIGRMRNLRLISAAVTATPVRRLDAADKRCFSGAKGVALRDEKSGNEHANRALGGTESETFRPGMPAVGDRKGGMRQRPNRQRNPGKGFTWTADPPPPPAEYKGLDGGAAMTNERGRNAGS